MIDTTALGKCRVVRLNAHLFPVSDFETSLWRRWHLNPIEAEANNRVQKRTLYLTRSFPMGQACKQIEQVVLVERYCWHLNLSIS